MKISNKTFEEIFNESNTDLNAPVKEPVEEPVKESDDDAYVASYDDDYDQYKEYEKQEKYIEEIVNNACSKAMAESKYIRLLVKEIQPKQETYISNIYMANDFDESAINNAVESCDCKNGIARINPKNFEIEVDGQGYTNTKTGKSGVVKQLITLEFVPESELTSDELDELDIHD